MVNCRNCGGRIKKFDITIKFESIILSWFKMKGGDLGGKK